MRSTLAGLILAAIDTFRNLVEVIAHPMREEFASECNRTNFIQRPSIEYYNGLREQHRKSVPGCVLIVTACPRYPLTVHVYTVVARCGSLDL